MTAELKRWVAELLAEVAELKDRAERNRNSVYEVIACRWSPDRNYGVELTISVDYNYRRDEPRSSSWARFRYGISTYSGCMQTGHGMCFDTLGAALLAFDSACAAMPTDVDRSSGDWADDALRGFRHDH